MEYTALGVLIGLTLILFIVLNQFNKRHDQIKASFIEYPTAKSPVDTLKELKAKEELERDYVWVEPDYFGMYLGEKIVDYRPELLSDVKFLRATGKYVRKDSIITK